jgi:DNA polymerase III alpha subunit
MNTQLRNRTLYYDGTNQVHPDLVPYLFLNGVAPEKIVVEAQSDDIDMFNSLSDEQITTQWKGGTEPSFRWKIPAEYLSIDLEQYVLQKTEPLGSAYTDRAKKELAEIKKRNLLNLFKTLIYVVDTFKNTQTLWGVGRGSSCASLVLYLIGLHMVDPVKFGISLEEFFHD